MVITELGLVVWSGGRQGCSHEGDAYTQAEVGGVRLVVRYNGNEYPVHLIRAGTWAIVPVNCLRYSEGTPLDRRGGR